MQTIFKVFIEFFTILLLFCFFGHQGCGILASQPGMDPTPPTLKGEVLTIGSPGKPLDFCSQRPSPKLPALGSSSRFIGTLPLSFTLSSGTFWRFQSVSLGPLIPDSIYSLNHSRAFPWGCTCGCSVFQGDRSLRSLSAPDGCGLCRTWFLTLWVSSVFVCWGYHNKEAHIVWHQQLTSSVSWLWSSPGSRCQQVIPSEGSTGESIPGLPPGAGAVVATSAVPRPVDASSSLWLCCHMAFSPRVCPCPNLLSLEGGHWSCWIRTLPMTSLT